MKLWWMKFRKWLGCKIWPDRQIEFVISKPNNIGGIRGDAG